MKVFKVELKTTPINIQTKVKDYLLEFKYQNMTLSYNDYDNSYYNLENVRCIKYNIIKINKNGIETVYAMNPEDSEVFKELINTIKYIKQLPWYKRLLNRGF